MRFELTDEMTCQHSERERELKRQKREVYNYKNENNNPNTLNNINYQALISNFQTNKTVFVCDLCADIGYSLEDLTGAMDDRDGWWERVRETRAGMMMMLW